MVVVFLFRRKLVIDLDRVECEGYDSRLTSIAWMAAINLNLLT